MSTTPSQTTRRLAAPTAFGRAMFSTAPVAQDVTRVWVRSDGPAREEPTAMRPRGRGTWTLFGVCLLSLVGGAVAGRVFEESVAHATAAPPAVPTIHTPRFAVVTPAQMVASAPCGKAERVVAKPARRRPARVAPPDAAFDLELAFRVTP
jgi:hypothetical protein